MTTASTSASLPAKEAIPIKAAFPGTPPTERLVSVDLLRGIVMVIMALDHVRDFFTYVRPAPEDVLNATLPLFFTRWITHFCAPVFFFLAGTGAFLSGSRKTPKEICHFLWTRGLLLVLMEETIVNFGWTFRPIVPGFSALVIWALGWSMVFLALLVRWLPVRVIAIAGVAIVAGHNLLDRVAPQQFGPSGILWNILHVPGFYQFTTFHGIPIIGIVLYPLVPWIGVMAAGYGFGAILRKPAEERRRWVLRLGAACVLLFVILRVGHLYGNPPVDFPSFVPSNGNFSLQSTASQSVVALLNVQKYPPSLQYLLMTLGPALILLGLMDRLTAASLSGGLGRAVLIYGRVPMFYYLLHIVLIHVMAVIVAFAFHQPAVWLLTGGFFTTGTPPGYGHGLPFIYLMWITAVAILYLPCKWFADLKARRKDAWLSYI
jgi:uncharacterized membrane protein